MRVGLSRGRQTGSVEASLCVKPPHRIEAEVHDLGEGLAARRQDEVDMIRHKDVGVEFVARTIVVEGFEEELGVTGGLRNQGRCSGGCSRPW